jgi:pilus assembly protein TadC
MSGASPDLTLILKQQKQMLDAFADFRDQLIVLTAICMRVEASVQSLTIEVRAMHSRHDRLARRVTDLEAAQP